MTIESWIEGLEFVIDGVYWGNSRCGVIPSLNCMLDMRAVSKAVLCTLVSPLNSMIDDSKSSVVCGWYGVVGMFYIRTFVV